MDDDAESSYTRSVSLPVSSLCGDVRGVDTRELNSVVQTSIITTDHKHAIVQRHNHMTGPWYWLHDAADGVHCPREWWHACDASCRFYPQAVAVTGHKDGFGSCFKAQLETLAFARAHCLHYHFLPFTANDDSWIRQKYHESHRLHWTQE